MFILTTNVKAQHNDSNFIIGELNHPRIIRFYKPLIEQAYRDIGLDVTFEKEGGERRLRLLNEGMTDADVIRYDVVAQPDNNIVVVPPALSDANHFYCVSKGLSATKAFFKTQIR